MKALTCGACGAPVYFENTACVACGAEQIYDPTLAAMVVAAPDAGCANRGVIGCNWIAAQGGLCRSCALTETIPDRTVPGNTARWARIEAAKRRLVYSLLRLGLPLEGGAAALVFRLMADHGGTPVLTGHADGVITVNIAEADDAEREERRVLMGESYRTLVGHFRHEVGHFYWDVLVDLGGRKGEFTEIFGDPDADYAVALQRHYREGPPPGWQQTHVSAYATAHPWEDFAETWAHYMHMVDAIETAGVFGLRGPGAVDPHRMESFAEILEPWVPVTVMMNAMNRSLGQPDFYPFVLSGAIERKLGFIHVLARDQRSVAGAP